MAEIRLAEWEDMQKVLQYDRHIPPAQLENCIRNGQVYVLQDAGNVLGVLRYSLFWQSIPFLDLLYIDETQRSKGFGRTLMAYWESVMQHKQYKYGMLSTQADETAKYFYEKLGYRCIGAFLPPEQQADELMYLKALEENNDR